MTQQASVLQAIRVALRGIATKWEIDYLRKLAGAGKWDCQWDQDTFAEMSDFDRKHIAGRDDEGRRASDRGYV